MIIYTIKYIFVLKPGSFYQSGDEQTGCGAVVGLPEPPQVLQAQRLPIQGLPTLLAGRQSAVAVLNAQVQISLEAGV